MKTKTRDYNSNILQPKLFYCLFVFYIIIWRKLNHLVAWMCSSQIIHLGDKARKQYCSNLIHVLLRFYFGHKESRFRTLHIFQIAFVSAFLKEQNCGLYKSVFFFFLVYMPEQTQRFFFPLEKLGLVLLYPSHFFIIKSWAHWHCSPKTIKEGCQKHSLLFQKF